MRFFAASIASLALAGCASSTVYVQVNTQPAGAFVTEFGTAVAIGMSPAYASYPRTSLTSRDATGCAIVRGFRAKWPSGAAAKSPDTLRLCGSGEVFNITIARDPNDPGLEQDLEFALKLSNASAAQRAAAAAEAGAAFQMMGVMQNAAPVNCSTMAVGKTLQTNCR
jgi:hypothetical protein